MLEFYLVSNQTQHPKFMLYVIEKERGNWFADDNGGNLFTSERMAKRAMDKWPELTKGCKIIPCPLDDDLAQMSQLFSYAELCGK